MRVSALALFVLREVRGGLWRSAFFALCVAIGVCAVVAVGSLADSIERGLRSHSRELLAADLALESRRPLPLELDELLAREMPGVGRIDVRELASMVGVPAPDGSIARSTLCELKVVGAGYPFYGDLELEPARALDELLSANEAVVSPALLASLQLELGDVLRVGGGEFRISGVARNEPDRLDFAMTLGPRVFLSQAGLVASELSGVGNRVKYKALLRAREDLSERQLAALRDRLRAGLTDASYLRIETHFEAQPGVRRGLERFRSYLGLVALLSLLLGGIGVAQIVRSWLRSHVLDIAVWKSLGLSRREILLAHGAHVLALACLGCLLGSLAGAALPLALMRLAPESLSLEALESFPLGAILRGSGLGLGLALLFALPVLAALSSITPAAVLRQIELPRASLPARLLSGLLLLGGVYLSSWVQSRDARVAGLFTLGLSGFALALWAAARVSLWLAARLARRSLPATIAHALASLARPASGTLGSIVALGLGSMVVTAMALIESRLGAALRGALPEQAPSVFLIDVQTDQWPGVRELLTRAGASEIKAAPVCMARLSAIDGVSVAELMRSGRGGQGGRGGPGEGEQLGGAEGARRADARDEREGPGGRRWGLTREQRLTWWSELPDSNRLVAGSLWEDPEHAEASLEADFAAGIGARLGSTLRFDLQGLPLEVVVTSLREVEWESFEINFFIVVEPGLLEQAPQVRLAAARVPPEAEAQLQDELLAGFPNVTLLRVRPILERVADLLERIALGVQVLGAFTVLAGILILAGAVVATRLGRAREVALLKTMGLTRVRVVRLFATEFALSGAVAALLGALGAAGLAWGFLEKVVQLEASLSLGVLAVSFALTVGMAVLAGLAASRRALAASPLETLRSARS